MEVKAQIAALDKIRITDIKELRKIYALHALATVPEAYAFNHPSKGKFEPLRIIEDENFNMLQNDELTILKSYQSVRLIPFSEISNSVNLSETYEQRKEKIDALTEGTNSNLHKQLDNLTKELDELPTLSIAQLFKNGKLQIDIANTDQKKLIETLLINGYIDEDDLDYISIFYPGKFTASDRKFMLHIKQEKPLEYKYELQNLINIVAELKPMNLKGVHCLNYHLLAFLLKNNANQSKVL